jgi:deoxyribose-phosphate aldolase
MPLDLHWVLSARVNKNAVDRRAASHGARRSVKKTWQAAWLLRAVSVMDLTTLSGDDTRSNVKRLCFKAKCPVRPDLVESMGVKELNITTGAVCVYPNQVANAVEFLKGSNVPVASVATGFPAGQTPLEMRLAEIRYAVGAGAREIDIVINRPLALGGEWQALYDEVKQMREACGEAHLKAILATGELGSFTTIARCSMVCMMAGADFIKTSTGKEPVNATIPVALVMVRCIRDYYQRTGFKVGFKPAGGIRQAKDALTWLALMKEELGDDWTKPDLFRIGASALLTDIERQLYHHVYGRYAAQHQLPMA